MSPFDKVTFEIERNDITYTCGGTIMATYTEDSTEMAIVSVLGSGDVLLVEQSELTAI